MLTSRIWILLILFFMCFFLKALILDPDLGWHLATGAYILGHGFPLTDPFSYSMPSYPYIAYAWLTDIVSLVIYKLLGIPGLAIPFAGAAVGSLLLLVPKQKTHLTMPFLLSGSILLFVMGIRPQVFSWLLFALLLVVLKSKEKLKYIFLPIIFLLWANIHSSFPLGLAVLVASILIPAFQNKKINPLDIGIIVGCLMVTLINPYGIRLWQEIFLIVAWPEKHFLLLDWYPGILVPYLPFWISIALSVFFLFKYKKHYLLFEKVIFVALVCVGFGAIVDIPYYAIFSFSLLAKGFMLYHEEKKKQHLLQRKWFKIAIVGIIFVHGLLLFYPRQYPVAAVAYLQKQKIEGNIFADFNWGGYLLWNLPEKKIFVDGHMPHWKQQNPKPDESKNAFQEYLLVVNQKEDLEAFSRKYKIKTLLVPPGFGDKEKLEKGGWKIVYKDATAVIYQKSN